MDLQARKLKAIEYVVGIEDENILYEIELTILKSQKQPKAEKALKPFTQRLSCRQGQNPGTGRKRIGKLVNR